MPRAPRSPWQATSRARERSSAPVTHSVTKGHLTAAATAVPQACYLNWAALVDPYLLLAGPPVHPASRARCARCPSPTGPPVRAAPPARRMHRGPTTAPPPSRAARAAPEPCTVPRAARRWAGSSCAALGAAQGPPRAVEGAPRARSGLRRAAWGPEGGGGERGSRLGRVWWCREVSQGVAQCCGAATGRGQLLVERAASPG